MREARTAHTIPQHARGGDGRPRVWRPPANIADDAQPLRPPACGGAQGHGRRRDGQPRAQGQHHHLLHAIRRAQVLQERALQRHLRTHGVLLQAPAGPRRAHSATRKVWRRLLPAPRRVPRAPRHLQGPLHHPAAQPAHRPARRRHGFACRPRRRRHSVGHIQARPRIGMEGRMHPLGAQQPNVDQAHGFARGMARLPRHLVEDAGVCRHARTGRGQPKRGGTTRTEEPARRSAQLVQRGPAGGPAHLARKDQGGHEEWVFRKFIVHSAQTGLYTKTPEYLTGKA